MKYVIFISSIVLVLFFPFIVSGLGSCEEGYIPTMGFDKTAPTSNLPKPALNVSFIDPAYNACMKRVTDHATQDPNNAGHPEYRLMKNNYARRNPYNADNTYAFIEGSAGWWHLYSLPSWSYVRQLPNGGSDTEPQWDPIDADKFWYLPNHGGLTILQYSITTNTSTTVADFENVASVNGDPGITSILDVFPDAEHIWTRAEGSSSADGRFWAFQIEKTSLPIWITLAIMVYDMEANTIVTYDLTTDGSGIGRPDHVSMSPTGNYLVASWHLPDQCASVSTLGTHSNPCGLMVFSQDLKTARGLLWKGPHSDLALDKKGEDVIVLGDYDGTGNHDAGIVKMIRLRDGKTTKLFDIYHPVGYVPANPAPSPGPTSAMHISGKAFDRPGWALVSFLGGNNVGEYIWYYNKLLAIELKENPTIMNIGHIYTHQNIKIGLKPWQTYAMEPHAAVNRDFTNVLFNSNWSDYNPETHLMENGRFDVDTYEVTLTDFWNSSSSSIRADVDQSQRVDSTDAMLTLRNAGGLTMLGTAWKASATTGDVNCDGVSDLFDSMLIQKYSLGLEIENSEWCE